MSRVISKTLGRGNEFGWMYDPEDGITIYREYGNGTKQVDNYSPNQIDQIMHFTRREKEVVLDNNVANLRDSNNVAGLAPFCSKQLNVDNTKAQAMGQFAAIMVEVDSFKFYKEGRTLKYSIKNYDWRTQIESFLKS